MIKNLHFKSEKIANDIVSDNIKGRHKAIDIVSE